VRAHHIDPERQRLYVRAIWIAVIGNGLLVVAKGLAAWSSGSTAVLATFVDSVTDLAYTIFMAWGLWLSQRPADQSHPQGHARVEPFVGTVVGVMMGVAGIEVIRRAIAQLQGAPISVQAGWPALVMVGSALVKLIMYLLVRRLGKQARSPGINAAAIDNLTDVFSSTVALFGLLAASRLHPLADPIAAIIVSLWIFRNAFEILRENVGYLTGRAAEPELLDAIQAAASSVDGVLGVHAIVADYVGPELRVDMHVEIDGDLSFRVAHDISDGVQEAVEALDEVDLAFVHLEPEGTH
jgi:cation diffusion facilitator family transporter